MYEQHITAAAALSRFEAYDYNNIGMYLFIGCVEHIVRRVKYRTNKEPSVRLRSMVINGLSANILVYFTIPIAAL